MAGEALELMRDAHRRSKEAMMQTDGCTLQGHTALRDGILAGQSADEILLKSVENVQITTENTNAIMSELKKGVMKKYSELASPQVPTLTGIPNVTKLETKWFKISTNQVEVGKVIVGGMFVLTLVVLVIALPTLYKKFKQEISQEMAVHIEKVVEENGNGHK